MPPPWGMCAPEFPARAPSPPLPIADRAITLKQLRELAEFLQRLCKVGLLKYPDNDFNRSQGRAGQRIKWSKITMHEITSELIKKVIPESSSCSYVELVGHGRKQPRTYFCSHNWGENFRDFAATIAHHSREFKVRTDEAYWICVFANNQWRIELGETLSQSPFYEALRGSKMTVVMMDKASKVLHRLWCVFEMHETHQLQQGFEFWTPLGRVGSALVSSGPALRALENMDVRLAEATNEVDQRQITNYIGGLSELTGIACGEDGKKVLEQDKPRRSYEKEVVEKNDTKFTSLNRAIVDASMGTLSVTSSRMPVLPSWDENGRPIEMRDQISPTRIADVVDRGMSLSQLRACREMVRGVIKSRTLKGTTGWPEVKEVRCTWGEPQNSSTQKQADMYNLNELFIKPMTKPAQCTYAELVADGPQPCDQFVSHCWATEFKSTMAALEWHAESRALPDTTIYWICVFANNQNTSFGSVDHDDLRLSGFYRALQIASGVAGIIENAAADGKCEPQLFRRMWCVFEAWAAGKSGKSFDLVTPHGILATTKPFGDGGWERGTFSASVATHLLKFDLRQARCSSKQDKAFLLNSIARRPLTDTPPEEHPAYDKLNERMRERVAGPALRDAAQSGDVAKVREVLDACPGLLLSSSALRGSLGESPVHVAADAGQLRALKLLLECKASANDQDLAGEAPLHYAALAGHAVAAWELYRSGADAELASFAGETPLDVAWQNPAYFCGVDTGAVADALMAASPDGGEFARREFLARLEDLRFSEEASSRCAQEHKEVEDKPRGLVEKIRGEVKSASDETKEFASVVP